ncbi:MAG: purine-nucleoside phosphorylase [Candidatus Wallbacteria bacterium]|nr:purine-nucleoside phosphorylase [Candidatus Wallbacteria bacterium]
MKKSIQEATDFITEKLSPIGKTAVILGSGLGFLAEQAAESKSISYQDIPHFKKSTVPGHAGKLVSGKLSGVRVLMMQGRYHYYEGHSMPEVTFPIRVLRNLGVENLILTNAAGGINPFYEVGDLMLLRDHINHGPNPLIGLPEGLGERFVPLDNLYSKRLRILARDIAEKENIPLREGVYLYTTGPSYETKAEILFFQHIGTDAVGMSTVPEAIVARHAGIANILAISLITNKTLGNYIPTHEEVMETGRKSKNYFAKLVTTLISSL